MRHRRLFLQWPVNEVNQGVRLTHTKGNFLSTTLARSLLLGFLTLGLLDLSVAADVLMSDSVGLPAGDASTAGPLPIHVSRLEVIKDSDTLEIVLYRPERLAAHSPAIVFLPGRMAAEDQYESYARALASRGFVVAVRTWYSVFRTDLELSRDASLIAHWLADQDWIDGGRIGIAGHSMGGKDAVLAAAQYGQFAGVVAIDPDDNGHISAVDGPIARLRIPVLLIGAEVAWQASSVCAPKATNYQRFFERAPVGTIELTLRDADHVQMLDEPDRFGYGICRCGRADSRQVRITARRATVEFFLQHLMGRPAHTQPNPRFASLRVVEKRSLDRGMKGPEQREHIADTQARILKEQI